MHMRDVVIVSAARTALGRVGGSIKTVQPEELAKIVILAAVERAGVEPEAVDEVIIGQTKQSADAANLARVAALKAGFPVEVPAYTVMRQCGSGLQAIHNAVQVIRADEAEIVVAGGIESMSLAPYYLRGARFGFTSGNTVVVDSNTESQPRSQPYEVYGDLTMGLTAENLAEKYDISREEQDAFALQSQERAADAIESGRFKDEIVPVEVPQRKGPPAVFDTDEHPRLSSLEQLAKLRPVFKEGGTVTAGNSSGRNDGGACLVLMDAETAKARGIKPLATIRGQATAAVDPRIMGIGPAPARSRRSSAPGSASRTSASSRSTRPSRRRAWPWSRSWTWTRRSSTSTAAPSRSGTRSGCSGARVLTTLLYEMRRRGTRYGLASICIAGGQGMATVVEMEH